MSVSPNGLVGDEELVQEWVVVNPYLHKYNINNIWAGVLIPHGGCRARRSVSTHKNWGEGVLVGPRL